MKISNRDLISLLPLIYYGTKQYIMGSKPIICLNKVSKMLSVSSSKLKTILKKLSDNNEYVEIRPRGRTPKLN